MNCQEKECTAEATCIVTTRTGARRMCLYHAVRAGDATITGPAICQ